MNDLTIVIKTFERTKALIRLLASIEKYYTNIPIIIVDDSKKDYSKIVSKRFKEMNIKYIFTEFNIGLSKGRNILLENVKTKYFLLCDDDFEFDERTDLDLAMKLYKEENLDILGGNVYNRFSLDTIYSILWTLKKFERVKKVIKKEEFCSIYNGVYDIKDKDIKLNINSNRENFKENKVYIVDICSNFFIGNTKKILNIGGWQPENLKVGEHEFFFLHAKQNNLKVGYTPAYGVRHFPKKTLGYIKFRMRITEYFKEACINEKIESFIVTDLTKKKLIFSYKKVIK